MLESDEVITFFSGSGKSKKSSEEISNKASRLSIFIPKTFSKSSSFLFKLKAISLKRLNCLLKFLGSPVYHCVATIEAPSRSTSFMNESVCISPYSSAGARTAKLSSFNFLTAKLAAILASKAIVELVKNVFL